MKSSSVPSFFFPPENFPELANIPGCMLMGVQRKFALRKLQIRTTVRPSTTRTTFWGLWWRNLEETHVQLPPRCLHVLSVGRAGSRAVSFLVLKGEGNSVRIQRLSFPCVPQFSSLLVVLWASALQKEDILQHWAPGLPSVEEPCTGLTKLSLPKEPFHGVRDACPRSIAKLSHHASFSSMVIRPMQCGRHQGDFRGGPGWEFHFCGTESCLNPQCYTDYMGKHLVPAAPLSCEVMKYRYRRGDSSTRKAWQWVRIQHCHVVAEKVSVVLGHVKGE